MAFFKNEIHENFKPDFGFAEPIRAGVCSNPAFADPKMHRVAMMKDEHWGSPGDRDEGGIPGWTSKYVCAGCGKAFKIKGFPGMFHPD